VNKIIIPTLFVLLLLKVNTVNAQQREHLIGVRAAYNISGLDSRPDISAVSVKTYGNYSVVYTYYHDLWKTINLFGFQAAISKSEQGFTVGEVTTRYEVLTIPFSLSILVSSRVSTPYIPGILCSLSHSSRLFLAFQ